MTEANTLQPLWDQLVGDDLSGVVFVRDYLQLQFNPPPQINATSAKITVRSGQSSADFRDKAFANMVIGLIGRVVSEVIVAEADSFRIVFADNAEIAISLRPEHYNGPEALYFQG